MITNGISIDGNTSTIDSAGKHQIIWTGNQWFEPGREDYSWGWSTPIYEKDYNPVLEKIKDMINNERSEDMINIERSEDMENKNTMKVYSVIVVDKKKCEIIKEQKIVAKDTETAMLDLSLGEDIRIKVKRDGVKFIFNELGSFEKPEAKEKE